MGHILSIFFSQLVRYWRQGSTSKILKSDVWCLVPPVSFQSLSSGAISINYKIEKTFQGNPEETEKHLGDTGFFEKYIETPKWAKKLKFIIFHVFHGFRAPMGQNLKLLFFS